MYSVTLERLLSRVFSVVPFASLH